MSADASLHLETPSTFPSFPFNPYSIQLDLMRSLYSAIEGRKVAILESPTGTGKTLSLLCGSLTWLCHEQERAKRGKLGTLGKVGSSEPDWVLEQSLERIRRELEEDERELEERLNKARQKEKALRDVENVRARKRQKLDASSSAESEEDEDRFLPDDAQPVNESDGNISPAVRELMKKLASSTAPKPGGSLPIEQEPICTKIIYASRTHTQLSQLKVELGKTSHSSTRAVPLASRRHLCINDDVRKKADVDEGCRELLQEKGSKRCPQLPSIDEESRMLDMRDAILATPKDIEDLYSTGQQMHTCPYFAARRAIPQAELVALPYNLLLSKSARDAIGLDLKEHVVIIDEAHNLLDTILSIHSVSLSSVTLATSLSQLKIYLTRFRTRLTTQHAVHLKRLVAFLVALVRVYQDHKDKEDLVITPSDLSTKLGNKSEGINLLEIEAYLKESRVARKISSYSDKLDEKEAAKVGTKTFQAKKGATPPLQSVETLINALCNASEDGRITFTSQNGLVHLKYQLLNPALHFKDIADSARAVILAGGTMAPISDIRNQLFPHLTDEQLEIFSCGHVIPKSNMLTLVVNKGPAGSNFEFKLASRSDTSLVAELGQSLLNLANVIPAGMVVFFPSYSFLDSVRAAWQKSGILDKLNGKKRLFFEPREGGEVETVLKDYAAAVISKDTFAKKVGAMMMAVVGAKLSEGLNFSDDLARSVVLVGLPFPNLGSVELKERMRYVTDLEKRGCLQRLPGAKDAGAELYENLAMKAVNQSIGRAIRHRDDWAALVLLDSRYGSPRISAKLPQWIGKELTISQTFGQSIKELSKFFRQRKESGGM